jgi:choline dehydrogenase-like flavoprotein
MERYPHLAVLTAMVHDTTTGRVKPRGEHELRIEYTPNRADRRELAHGLIACVRLLFAAGARRVFVPTDPLILLEAGDPLPRPEDLRITPDRCRLSAVHPLGSIPMGDDPAHAAVDSRGRHHEIEGLWVADGSLFPSSIGVPPQLSIYALGLHVGRSIIAAG